MVKVNTVGKGGAIKPTVTKPDESLTQSKNVPANLQKQASSLVLPDFLQEDTDIVLANNNLTGYVGFADHRSKNWSAMQAAGCEVGDPFMFRDGQYTPLNPFQYFLVKVETYRTTMVGQEGKFVFVTKDIETPLVDLQKKYPDKIVNRERGVGKAEPHYVCLTLLLLNEQTLVPMKADIRGTKTGAVEAPSRAIEAAATPDWITKSDAHKISGMFPKPWGRVFHTVTTHPKTGKTSGDGFHVCNAVSVPTSVTLMESLYAAFKDQDFINDFKEADANYKARIDHFDKIAVS